MSKLDTAEAARLLGMKQSEVHRVIDTDAGPVAVTTDGTECLFRGGRITFPNRPGVPGGTYDPSLIDSASAGGIVSGDAQSGAVAVAEIAAGGFRTHDGKLRPEPPEPVDEDAVRRRAVESSSGGSVPVAPDGPPTKADGTDDPAKGGDAKKLADFEKEHGGDRGDDPARSGVPVKKAAASRGRS